MIKTELIAPLSELLGRQAERFPGKIAFSDARRSITYEELKTAAHNLASHFRAQGLQDGGTVAIWLPNCVEWVIACLAAICARGTAVPVSFDAVESEVSYRLADAECAIVVTTPEKTDTLTKMTRTMQVPKCQVVLCGALEGDELDLAALCAAPSPGITLSPDDIDACAYIFYTSGTTGRPKGVMLSSRRLLWSTAACWAPILGFSDADRILNPLPLFHVYAMTISVLTPLATGGSCHVMDRFSVNDAIGLLQSGEFTFFPAVPTMFHYILLEGRKHGRDLFSGIRLCASAGAIMPGTLSRELEDTFGVEVIDGYGITEMSAMVTMNWPGKNRISGSCGLPIPGLALRIIDPATGHDVKFGDEGELICRGPNLMLGYNRKSEETGKVIRDGWYHTGDLARSDQYGFLTITGRLKEIIIRGGQNIAPAEVEETILKIDDVMDCAVVGIPHETLGEVACAFCVMHEGKTIDPEGVKAFCEADLSAYKIPESVRSIEKIPRTGSGKIMRFKLQELVDGPAA